VQTRDLRVGALVYFVGSHDAHGVLVAPEGVSHRFHVGQVADLIPQVASLVSALRDPGGGAARVAFDRFAGDWGATLLPPELMVTGLDVLVVIPHHLLHGLPIHAVLMGDQPIAAQYGVTYCSSLRLLLHAMGHNPLRVHRPSWEFTLEGPATPLGRDRTCVVYSGDVVSSRPEYEQLAESFCAHFDTSFRVGSDDVTAGTVDTRGWFKVVAPHAKFRIFCAVCHGFADETTPSLSGLLVGTGPDVRSSFPLNLKDDVSFRIRDWPFRMPPAELPGIHTGNVEVLTALEVAVGPTPATELACLLGCSTARGEPMASDDVASLAHQWLKTDTGTVLATLWGLDLQVLSMWLPHFLSNWVGRQQPKAIAWRQAARALIAERPDLPPGQWATVALLGDWL
jgi:hypothetical protein